jgi:SAM-dependent methyltransferase
VVPVSRVYGFDRGQPVDRYYIERFLARNAECIRGRVLEIGGSTYTRRFGGRRVTEVDVLHVREGNPEATLVGDLSAGRHFPSGAFDCILLVQTLQLIFDVDAAARTLCRMLKPGGVLLATFPGISHKGRDEWADVWQWGFTSVSAARVFGRVFPADHLAIERHGNVLATTAFLYGLASSELSPEELDYSDDCYEMLIALRAVKPAYPLVNAVGHRSWRRVIDAAIHRASALAQFDVFYGTLERPRAGAIRGPFEISGWICSRTSPVERVEAFLGDTPLGTLDYGYERPDVAAVFPALPAAAWSGYRKAFTLDPRICGRQRLVVRATDRRGNSTAFCRRVIL